LFFSIINSEQRRKIQSTTQRSNTNLHAKKFDASQKAVIASRLMPFYSLAAKERQVEALKRGNETKHGEDSSIVEKIPPSKQKTKARDEAGKAAGVNGRYVDMDWMDANQLGRRNLADIDLIALERKRESILRPLAKENLSKGGGDQKSGSAKLPKAIKPIDTRKECAKAAGVSTPASSSGWLGLAWRKAGLP
jgi:hypothetical protein